MHWETCVQWPLQWCNQVTWATAALTITYSELKIWTEYVLLYTPTFFNNINCVTVWVSWKWCTMKPFGSIPDSSFTKVLITSYAPFTWCWLDSESLQVSIQFNVKSIILEPHFQVTLLVSYSKGSEKVKRLHLFLKEGKSTKIFLKTIWYCGWKLLGNLLILALRCQ